MGDKVRPLKPDNPHLLDSELNARVFRWIASTDHLIFGASHIAPDNRIANSSPGPEFPGPWLRPVETVPTLRNDAVTHSASARKFQAETPNGT
jgi:hypothetical protein